MAISCILSDYPTFLGGTQSVPSNPELIMQANSLTDFAWGHT